MNSEFASLVTEHGRNPEIVEELSFEMYEDWATSQLLHPDDIRYYRLKFIEETHENVQAVSNKEIIEEAGDLIWTLTALRNLVVNKLSLDDEQPEFYSSSLKSIVGAWSFNLDINEMEDYLSNYTKLFERKAKIAFWHSDDASTETKREYILNVLNDLTPLIISLVTKITELKTGQGIDVIVSANVRKLEERIAQGQLDKSLR